MIALLILLADCPATSLPAGAHHFTAGKTDYDVIIPKMVMPPLGFPAVIALHGAGSNPAEFNATTRLPEIAGRDPFVLVLPRDATDTATIKEIIDRLLTQTCVDQARIYAVGHGEGANTAHQLACDLSERLAAVAAVSGGAVLECKPKRRIPIMEVHGSADTCFPDNAAIMTGWRERNGCGERMRVTRKVGSTTCKTFDGCPDHADVVTCKVEDGGHGWPGGGPDIDKKRCGGQLLTDFNAAAAIWTFFKEHPLPPSTVNVGRPPQDLDVILRGGKP